MVRGAAPTTKAESLQALRRLFIESLVLQNWPAGRSRQKDADDIKSTVEAVSLVPLPIPVEFLDNDFDAWAVRAFAKHETGWVL